MHVLLLGRRWKLSFRALRPREVTCSECNGEGSVEQEDDGRCLFEKQEIHIKRDLSGSDLVETLIHEMTHAAFPWMDEYHVSHFARDVTAVLSRCNCIDAAKSQP